MLWNPPKFFSHRSPLPAFVRWPLVTIGPNSPQVQAPLVARDLGTFAGSSSVHCFPTEVLASPNRTLSSSSTTPYLQAHVSLTTQFRKRFLPYQTHSFTADLNTFESHFSLALDARHLDIRRAIISLAFLDRTLLALCVHASQRGALRKEPICYKCHDLSCLW